MTQDKRPKVILEIALFFLIGALISSCTQAPKHVRAPMFAMGCFGSVFLANGQLAKLEFRKLSTIKNPYAVSSIREVVMSPDYEVLAILAQSGTPSNPSSDLLFYECRISKWHMGLRGNPGFKFSKLRWRLDGNSIAFLQQSVEQSRAIGKDWHQFTESVLSVNWPSFESRQLLSLKSELRPGVGLLSDVVVQDISRIRDFQFHPSQQLMVFQTIPKNRTQLRVFRILDLAKAKPEYPVDYTQWFEVLATQKPHLYLSETSGVLLRLSQGEWAYSTASLGNSDFKSMKVDKVLKGKGLRPLFFRDDTLYLELKTTSRTHIYGLTIAPEASPFFQERRLSSHTLESVFSFEGQDSTASDFDVVMNRVLYSCRSKKTTLNRVCIGRVSDEAIAHPAVMASDQSSVYPILTYWPR